jgi:hypothetical protein
MMKSIILAVFAIVVAACGASAGPNSTETSPRESRADAARSSRERTLFIQSAVEHADGTVTLPLHRGTSRGRTVFYVVFDSSSGEDASAKGINESQKLAHARGTTAVQRIEVVNGLVDFPASVDFSHGRQVVPGPQGFPPAVAVPGPLGEPGYSPLIELPDGTIENAPQVANDSGQAPKVVTLDVAAGTVTLRETNGFQGGNAVHYVSLDASNPVAATLENATFAPALDAAPFAGGDGTDQSRATLVGFVNGQTGAGNPQRQGLSSALLDGLDPLNLLRWNPSQGRYSPLWDVNLAAWTAEAVARGLNNRQMDVGDAFGLAEQGLITAPEGSPFTASGFIVVCPIVSSE